MSIRTERGGKFKTMRSTRESRKILKKWKGGELPYNTLFMALPGNMYQVNPKSKGTLNWVDFKCDVCGFIHSIKSNHTIDKDGNVEKSFGGPDVGSGCGFHEYLKLEDWVSG